MSEEKFSNDDTREFVPGTTAGPTSPGTTAFPAGSPAPIFFGATQPMGQTYIPGSVAPPFAAPPVQFGIQPGTAPHSTMGLGIQPGPTPQIAPGLGMQQPTAEDFAYTQGYLRSQIGKNVRIQFLIGESLFTDRRGTIVQVGIDYVVLREAESDDLLACDLYSIKFVNTYL